MHEICWVISTVAVVVWSIACMFNERSSPAQLLYCALSLHTTSSALSNPITKLLPRVTNVNNVLVYVYSLQYGRNPVHVVSWIENWANINIFSLFFMAQNGVTPLYVASLKGHRAVVELLLGNGADVSICNKVLTTPPLLDKIICTSLTCKRIAWVS